MSAQNIIPSELVERKLIVNKSTHHNDASVIALGIIFLVLTIVIMSGVLIYMVMSGGSSETTLLLGITPFVLMFLILILSK